MSTIKGYTYIHKFNDNNSFDLAIWDELQKGALSNHGKAFSFKLQFVTEKRHFRAEESFWSGAIKWAHRGTDRYDRLERFKSYASNYTSKLSLSLNETCFSDTRRPVTTLTIYDITREAEAEYGYIATFDVPEEYSQEIYNTYALEAIPFCNQLLSQHRELLIQMTKGLLNEEGLAEGSLFVSSDGVYNGCYRNDSDYRKYKKFFADFGRPPLVSVQQCYGFVLALIEIYGHQWELSGTLKLEVSVDHGKKLFRAANDDFVAIKLHYRTYKEKPVLPLKPW